MTNSCPLPRRSSHVKVRSRIRTYLHSRKHNRCCFRNGSGKQMQHIPQRKSASARCSKSHGSSSSLTITVSTMRSGTCGTLTSVDDCTQLLLASPLKDRTLVRALSASIEQRSLERKKESSGS